MVLEQIYNNLIAGNAWLTIVKGIGVTVKISVLSLLLGTALGTLVCGMRRSKLRLLSAFAKLYIAILRGSPVSMLLLLFYYGIFAKSPLDAATIAVLAFGMNTAAYVPPGDLPNPGIEPESPMSPALQADSLLDDPSGKSLWIMK